MSIAVVEEKSVITGHPILDTELSLMTFVELDYLGKYLRLMRELGEKFDEGYSWADATLTAEEEAQVEEWRKKFENEEYLTLDEFMEGL